MTYTVKEAKDKLSGLIRLAEKGQPQVIRRHDKEVAVVVSIEDWRRTGGGGGGKSLLEVLRSCPFDLTELDLSRQNDLPREFDFEDL